MDEEITNFNQSRELHLANAHEIIRMLRAGEIKPKCLVDVCKQRHASQDSIVHSTPTTCFERAETFINEHLKDTILGGCPVLIKDLNEVENVRTTFGSVLYADFVPKQSDPTVCLLETNGAVVCGKTNSPEFGAGSQTFNRLFPSTRSPRDIRTTSGGSSGGSASALASHQCWLASGSDLGGSLRIPAAFCGVVGFRASPGLTVRDDEETKSGPRHNLHAVDGPMGRVVRDVAIFLDAMTTKTKRTPGWDFDSPSFDKKKMPSILVSDGPCSDNYFETISMRATKKAILLLRRDKTRKSNTKLTVGFSTLNCPCDSQIERCCLNAARLFVKYLRYVVRVVRISFVSLHNRLLEHRYESDTVSLQRHVRFDDKTAWRLFSVLRAEKFRTSFEKLVKSSSTHRYDLKPEVVWNTEQGMMEGHNVTEALKESETFLAEIERLFRDDIDLLLVPATPCLSFDVNVRYPNTICGAQCDSYLDWMRLACVISSTGCPTAVIPCGFSCDGRTIGIQIVAPPGRDDIAVAAASFLETILHCELPSVRAIHAAESEPMLGTCDLSDVDGPRTSQDAARHHNLSDWKEGWLVDE